MDVQMLSCGNCGAPLETGPSLGVFVCRHCDTSHAALHNGGAPIVKRAGAEHQPGSPAARSRRKDPTVIGEEVACLLSGTTSQNAPAEIGPNNHKAPLAVGAISFVIGLVLLLFGAAMDQPLLTLGIVGLGLAALVEIIDGSCNDKTV